MNTRNRDNNTVFKSDDVNEVYTNKHTSFFFFFSFSFLFLFSFFRISFLDIYPFHSYVSYGSQVKVGGIAPIEEGNLK